MKLESQVCSLEYAKRLKELGVKQDSLFYRFGTYEIQYIFCKEYEQYSPNVNLDIKTGYSAFTITELSEITFQLNYDNLEETGYLEITTEMVDRSGGYFYRLTNNLSDHIVDDLKEVDARAKMLIYLLENGLIKNDN